MSLLILVGLCIFLAHFGQSMGAMLIVPKPAWWLVRHLDNTEIVSHDGGFSTPNIPKFSSETISHLLQMNLFLSHY
jgi:hypothetical protein